MRRLPIFIAMLALACTLVIPASALASTRVIRDCTDDGELNRSYSNSDLRDALDNLPADIDEYSDCRDVINDAFRSGGRGDGGGGGGGGGFGSGGGPGSGFFGQGFDVQGDDDVSFSAAESALIDDVAGIDGGEGRGASGVDFDGSGPADAVQPGEPGLGFANALFGSNDVPLPLAVLLAVVLAGAAITGLVALRSSGIVGRALAADGPIRRRFSGPGGSRGLGERWAALRSRVVGRLRRP